MPGPVFDHQPAEREQPAQPRHGLDDRDVALHLPEWDLLPPAEFLNRHPRRR